MGLITFILLLMIAPAMGVILGSSILAMTDPYVAIRRRAAAGRRRPPGALLMPRKSLLLRPMRRYEVEAVARGALLRVPRTSVLSAADRGAALTPAAPAMP
jgi:hypothetical protein